MTVQEKNANGLRLLALTREIAQRVLNNTTVPEEAIADLIKELREFAEFAMRLHLETLPPEGSVFSLGSRAEWLRTMAGLFDLAYGFDPRRYSITIEIVKGDPA